MEVFLVFLLLKLDAIRNALVALTFILGIVAVLSLVVYFMNYCDYRLYHEDGKPDVWRKFPAPVRVMVWVFPFMSVMAILSPTTKELAILIGAHYVVEAASSPEGIKAQVLVRQKLNELLDEQLNKKPAVH